MKILFFILFLMSCSSNNLQNTKAIKSYQLREGPDRLFKLSNKLQEISGLAMTADGRLFGHDDEHAEIYQINYTSGKVIKSFSLGKKTLRGDFEGLATVNDIFYLGSSNGVLYEFKEGNDGDHVDYVTYKTHLKLKNDVEGLCYDPLTNCLLLACKGNHGQDYSGYKTIYSFSLSDKELSKKPRFMISLTELTEQIEKSFSQQIADFFQISEATFAPSGIEMHPDGNSFFILSAQGRLIVEVSGEGKILGFATLNKKTHPQPEGITFTPGKDLIIADEGGKGKATITVYKYLPDQ
jgi:uncharacterized protein YjiK